MISGQGYKEEILSSMEKTKTKRDEFLVEIRKKKNQMIILKKRIKLFGSSDDQPYPTMQEELHSDVKEIFPITHEMQNRLNQVYEGFHACLNRQDFNGLIPQIKLFRELITDKFEPIPGKVIVELGIVPHLISLLEEKFSQYQQLQIEIAWFLANLTAGSSDDTAYLVDQNIIPTLSQCLRFTTSEDLQENAMWSLANISGESCLSFRDKILAENVLNLVVREIYKTQKNTIYYRTAAWLISNLVRGKPFPPYEKIEKSFAALTHLIDYPDEVIQQHTLLSLAFLTEEATENHFKSIKENNLIQKIVHYINSKDDKIALNAVKISGNIALQGKLLTNKLCENEIFKAISNVLTSENNVLRKEACMTLSNIFHQDFDDHDYIIDNKILPTLIDIADQDEDEIKTQGTICLYEFLSKCSATEALLAMKKGAVKIFLQNLQSNYARLIENSLLAFDKAFEHGENMKEKNDGNNPLVLEIRQNNLKYIFEELQNHPQETIAFKAELILNKFFTHPYLETSLL